MCQINVVICIFFMLKKKNFKIVLLLYWSKIYAIIGLLVLLSDLSCFSPPLPNFALKKYCCVLSLLPRNSPNFLYIHICPRNCVSCPKFHARRNLFCFKLRKYKISPYIIYTIEEFVVCKFFLLVNIFK